MPTMPPSLKTVFWRCLAALFLLLGIIGVFLPVMPTVPFVLVAAWAASKGWPELECWLLNHPQFGHSIREWRSRGAVSRRAKWCATLGMAGSAVLLQFIPLPHWASWARWWVPVIFVVVLVWLWRRPEH